LAAPASGRLATGTLRTVRRTWLAKPGDSKHLGDVRIAKRIHNGRTAGNGAPTVEGDVFTSDLIEMWIDLKRRSEVESVRLRPHPWEFALYYES
jgi:hypothetical protein